MKKIRITFIKTQNSLIATLMAIIGFATSCVFKSEYGSPSAEFIVNGTVKSADTEQPIENIRVILQTDRSDTTLTDKDGKYQLVDKWGYPYDQTYNIQFQDIDGASNNEYENLDTIVEFKDPEFSGGDGNWNHGETSKEFDVKLTSKK